MEKPECKAFGIVRILIAGLILSESPLAVNSRDERRAAVDSHRRLGFLVAKQSMNPSVLSEPFFQLFGLTSLTNVQKISFLKNICVSRADFWLSDEHLGKVAAVGNVAQPHAGVIRRE